MINYWNVRLEIPTGPIRDTICFTKRRKARIGYFLFIIL